MDPEIRNFAEIERFIKEHPKEADALAAQWQEFVGQNPDVLSFETAEEFYEWAAQKHTDPNIWVGKEVTEAYFYLRSQHEDSQIQTQGGVNPSIVPTELVALPILALAYRDRPKIIEDDKDYQKLVDQHKKTWLENNEGKDFTSKEGLDYLYGSLDDESAPSLKKDAEQAFRNNPKYRKRLERYDKESKKVYKNPDDDPRVIRTRGEIEAHIKARQEYLKTHEEDKKPEDVSRIIQKQSWERFVEKHPEKTKIYGQSNIDIKKAYEKQEIKKQLADLEQKTGRQVHYVEKIHRQQDVSLEEATRRLESIKPSQPQKEEDQKSRPSINIRQITKQLEGQAKTEAPAEGLVNRGIGRGIGDFGRGSARLGGRLAGRTGSMVGRLGSRLAAQAGMAVGRAAVSGVAAAAGNPIGLIVIAVIVVIIIIVFLIIMFAGGGGSKPVATIDCGLDPDGNIFVAPDGNTCAQNLAAYYSKQESAVVTAKCLDKCTDSARTLSCDRDPATNECDIILYNSCGGDKVFCVEYSPSNAALNRLYDCVNRELVGSPLGVNSCGGAIAPTPTP